MKILLIGNSYSYYWTDELYGLLTAAGEKDVRVSNVYYSGCTFERHHNWHVAGEKNYTFCTVAKGERTTEKGVDLEHCLSSDEWDLISFQESNRYREEDMRRTVGEHLPYLYNLVHSRFPNAKYVWQHNWAHEIYRASGKGEDSLEDQLKRNETFARIAGEVCAEYGFQRIPLGDAWVLVRHDPLFFEKGEGEFPVRSLHTRIMHAGAHKGEIINSDPSHDGDVGGGQYLNACVWFEMLTKKSVVGNPFRPFYVYKGLDMTLSEEKIALLQNAAHKAVLTAYGEAFYEK